MKVLNVWFGHGEGRKEVELSLELPHATVLRVLCGGMSPTDALCSFFEQAAMEHPHEAQAFVTRFLSEITTKLDLSSLPLDTKPGYEGDTFDFGRPSPSWLMLKRFLEGLWSVPHYRQTLQSFRSSLPHYVSTN